MACGPSFQAIYEGNARFEHCYALEENAQTAMHEKADCWRDWSEHYTFGQTRDRIHYATARYVALSQSQNLPTDEAMMMGAPGVTPRQTTITAPAPTNAFAPPPKVLYEGDAAPSRAPRASEVPTVVTGADGGSANLGPLALPGADCGETCGRKLRDCTEGCTGDAGGAFHGDGGPAKPNPACATCEKTYRTCMRGCYK